MNGLIKLDINRTENGFSVHVGQRQLTARSIGQLCELIANEAENQYKMHPKDICLCVCLNDVLPFTAL